MTRMIRGWHWFEPNAMPRKALKPSMPEPLGQRRMETGPTVMELAEQRRNGIPNAPRNDSGTNERPRASRVRESKIFWDLRLKQDTDERTLERVMMDQVGRVTRTKGAGHAVSLLIEGLFDSDPPQPAAVRKCIISIMGERMDLPEYGSYRYKINGTLLEAVEDTDGEVGHRAARALLRRCWSGRLDRIERSAAVEKMEKLRANLKQAHEEYLERNLLGIINLIRYWEQYDPDIRNALAATA